MKKEFILLVIVGCQVFLLMNMVIADSYIIGQANPLMENLRGMNENNKIKNLINLGMNLLTGFLSLKQISFVSAEVGFECCLETNEGGICQDIISGSDSSTDANSCASPLQTGCDSVSECAKGCCVDSIEGLCTTQALQQECVNSDGIWNDEDSCLVQECQKGCCMIGNNAKFITEKRCEYLSSLQGLDKDFRDLETELECLALSSSQDEGACVLSGICNRKTKQECFAIGGEFYNNLFCSAAPGINCSAGEVIGCADEENLHDVYYFDSCGNRENIAKECDYPENTCDDKSCKYLGCENAVANVGTQDRANGERWCLYDGSIGDGKDTVGSEHWIAYCHNGEVEIDRCGEYRGSICTQSVIEEDGETFSQASCVINEAFSCIDYNSEQSTLKENCEANTDCMIKNINVDTGFKFDVCTPRYPHGFELTGGESLRKSLSTELCSLANQNCTVLYEKKLLGGWSCKSGGNCNCEKAEFTNQMNDFCVSLGDCGSYVNYIGEGTKNIKVSGAPEVSWTKYIKYSEPVKGQFAEPKSLREILGSMFGTNIVDPDNNETGMNKLVKKIGMISGASGTLVVGAGWLGNFIGGQVDNQCIVY